jgi:hypothetical protein
VAVAFAFAMQIPSIAPPHPTGKATVAATRGYVPEGTLRQVN